MKFFSRAKIGRVEVAFRDFILDKAVAKARDPKSPLWKILIGMIVCKD